MVATPNEIVRSFYAAAAAKDADALADLLATSFREDAAIEWPAGLPYGGRVEGVAMLGKVFAGLASEGAPLGPQRLALVSVIDAGGDQIAAEVAFDFRVGERAIPSGALEIWTFADGLVAECRAFYWDTAAIADLVRPFMNPA